MKPSLSVIVPTRQRVPQLDRMLRSLWKTAVHPGQIEVICRIDDDDGESQDYFAGTMVPMAEHTRVIVGSRLNGYATLATLTNEAAREAQADLILVVNDDVEFQTLGWDTKLLAAAATYRDGIFVLGVTTMNAGKFVFPCVSRRQIDLLGGVFDERLVYTDIWLRDVVKPFGRAIRVPEVTITHHWEGRTADQEAAAKPTETPAYQALYAQCVKEGQQKIRKVLR
jgi:glycosyl transferase/beta-hydroxylase protein BlmF